MGVLVRFYRTGSRDFELSFYPEVGNSPIKKLLGGWSGLKLTDTLDRNAIVK